MRYYLYVSTAKLGMLHPQISSSPKISASEIGIDLRVIHAKRSTTRNIQAAPLEQLNTVEDWIYSHESVGSVDEPEAWIYGRLNLGASNFAEEEELSEQEISAEGVLFGGITDAESAIILGGSGRHLTAGPRYADKEGHSHYFSWSVALMRALTSFNRDADGFRGYGGPYDDDWLYDEIIRAARHMLNGYMGMPLGSCEFLAKRLRTVTAGRYEEGGIATLATPLFVALEE